MNLLPLLLLWFLPGNNRGQEDCYAFNRLSFEKPGDITLTGIFDASTGENCTLPVDFGVEEMAAAVWTVTALERYGYLPGIKIGLTLFDACTGTKAAQEALAEAIIWESCHNLTDAGILASPEVETRLGSFSEKLSRKITRLEHVLDVDGLLTIVAELLTNLHWTTVNRVIADTRESLTRFSLRMSDEGICVYDEVLSSDTYAVNNEVIKPIDVPHEEVVSKDVPVIVVLCGSEQISAIFEEMTREMRMMTIKWLLVPTDFMLNVPAGNLPEKVFSVLPLVDRQDRLLKFLADSEMQKDHMNHREATRSPLFVKVAAGILRLLEPFRALGEAHCRGGGTCPELSKLIEDVRGGGAVLEPIRSVRLTPERIMNALDVLKMDPSDSETFLYITSSMKGEKTEDAAIFQVFDVKSRKIRPVPLIVNERQFNERRSRTKRTKRVFRVSVDDIERIRKKEEIRYEVTDASEDDAAADEKHPCLDILSGEYGNLSRSCGICQNLVRFLARGTEASTEEVAEEAAPATWSWRFRTWVAINASVASIGVICTLAVVTFILFRMIKGDVLEGSPHFSFIILLSILALYASTLPFSVDESQPGIISLLRVVAPTTTYPILFSAILSRSAMLVVSERDGSVMNHVNGCLQSVLCFFMCAVQVALTAQFWLYDAFGEDSAVSRSDHKFVILLAYSFFLLVLLALSAPFTFRSKRNYREGTCFGVATAFVLLVWVAWVTFYYLLPVEEKDAAVAFGLTGTATAVLLAVFIPRTYLMATATVRDKIANTLPSLAYLNASNISELNYRSSQALYDSVTVKCGSPKLSFSNSRVYTVQVSNSAPASPVNLNGGDYILNRRKTFIEVPGVDSPVNSYDSESPDLTGNMTRF